MKNSSYKGNLLTNEDQKSSLLSIPEEKANDEAAFWERINLAASCLTVGQKSINPSYIKKSILSHSIRISNPSIKESIASSHSSCFCCLDIEE
jgi:hypothetical protein